MKHYLKQAVDSAYKTPKKILEIMEQETIREEAENYYEDEVSINGFINGAIFQAERMYSEEEVFKIAEEVRWQAIGDPLEFTKNFEEWFEQFKKK